jgi:hypothetical protein
MQANVNILCFICSFRTRSTHVRILSKGLFRKTIHATLLECIVVFTIVKTGVVWRKRDTSQPVG